MAADKLDLNALQSFVASGVARHKMFVELGDVVASAKSLEQYKTELTTSIEAAKSDLASIRDQLAKEQSEAQEKQRAMADTVASARASAAQQAKQAEIDLAAVAARHEAQIKVIDGKITAENAKLADVVARGDEAARDYSDKLVLLQSQVKEWQTKLDTVKAQYETFVAGLVK